MPARNGDDLMTDDSHMVDVSTLSVTMDEADAEAWEPVSEDELVSLALAADPDALPDDDAVPVDAYLGTQPSLLPLWYMPRPIARSGSRWRLAVVVTVVGAFLVIEALGLCSVFGHVTIG
jgi:hypothetical protein